MSFSGIHNLDILRFERMTDFVRKVPSTGPHYCYETFFRPNQKPLRGTDTASWDEVTRTRRRAPYGVRGAPAQRMDLLTRARRSCSVADIFISKALTGEQLEYLRKYGTEDVEGARAMINEELEDMVDLIHNTREHACYSVLRGSFSADQSASTTAVKHKGAVFTLTFNVTTMTASNSWASASTNIYTDELTAIENKGAELGSPITRAIHERTIADNLLKNTEVKSFLGESYKTQLLNSGKITRVRGIDFIGYDTGDDDGGSWAKYITDPTEVLFLPGDNKNFRLFEADTLIPTPDGNDLMRVTPGIYSYADITKNPAGIELFVGYRFLPVNLYPERIIRFDSVP